MKRNAHYRIPCHNFGTIRGEAWLLSLPPEPEVIATKYHLPSTAFTNIGPPLSPGLAGFSPLTVPAVHNHGGRSGIVTLVGFKFLSPVKVIDLIMLGAGIIGTVAYRRR